MTRSQITQAHQKIEKCKQDGYFLEALFLNYHLNISMLQFIFVKLDPGTQTKNVKVKQLLNQLIEEVDKNSSSKTIISKKNLKALKPWLVRMDAYLKALKVKQPASTKNLLRESENIFNLLNIATAKLMASK